MVVNEIQTFFWDFDGVLMDSNAVRVLGFEPVLAKFLKDQVDQLLAFHQAKGGLSRYVKFCYFFKRFEMSQYPTMTYLFGQNVFHLS